MCPSFHPSERQRITEQLRATAADLFTTRGLRKTTLEDLTGAVGISKSGFYSFFDSKESLYLALMLEKLADIRPRLVNASTGARDARDGIVAILWEIVRILNEDPMYRRLLTHPEELAAVRDRLGEQQHQRVHAELVEPLHAFITEAQHHDAVVQADPAVVVGVLQAVVLVPVHGQELDPETFPAVLDLLIGSVATGLTKH